ncbi:transcriptional repressor NrdR [Candidatus Woesearchaeota archaeon]|jgi:transcriptional repressor NrdR|nr:transcriptional repressor NrdR [Candidatus Woesearchaeota archaeon]
MLCPYCNQSDTKVVDKRDNEDYTRRRRECLKCERRFTSYERAELATLMVIKRDGTREEFDRNKVLKGFQTACEKRSVSTEVLEKAALEIESEIRKKDANEIASKIIGRAVLKRLKKIDKVGYMRFASIYLEFANIDDFEKELNKLS